MSYVFNTLFVFQSLTVRDTVRECLEKDPCERTEDDIEVLLEFMQHLPVSADIELYQFILLVFG